MKGIPLVGDAILVGPDDSDPERWYLGTVEEVSDAEILVRVPEHPKAELVAVRLEKRGEDWDTLK